MNHKILTKILDLEYNDTTENKKIKIFQDAIIQQEKRLAQQLQEFLIERKQIKKSITELQILIIELFKELENDSKK